MSKQEISRREFIGRTVGGAAAASLGLGAPALGRVASPNEKITVGVIGAGIRGLENMQSLLNAGANVAVVCDLYDGTSVVRRRSRPTRLRRATIARCLIARISTPC